MEDFPSAAGKHLLDSRLLLAASRWDGAAYLAGYAVECVVKLIIKVESGDFFGHLPDIGPRAASLAALPGARTARYITNANVHNMPLRLPAGWEPALRYEAEGAIPETSARSWMGEAERLYAEIVVPMRLDGLF